MTPDILQGDPYYREGREDYARYPFSCRWKYEDKSRQIRYELGYYQAREDADHADWQASESEEG